MPAPMPLRHLADFFIYFLQKAAMKVIVQSIPALNNRNLAVKAINLILDSRRKR